MDVPSTERIYIGSFTKIIIKPFDDKRAEFTFYPEDKDGDGHANGTQVFSPETKITLRSYSNQNVFSRDAVTDSKDIPIMTGYYTVTSIVTEPESFDPLADPWDFDTNTQILIIGLLVIFIIYLSYQETD